LKELANKIHETEKNHKQWKKQFINFGIFLCLAAFNLFRGSKKNPSIFGIALCGAADWISLGVFVVVCFIISVSSLKTLQRE